MVPMGMRDKDVTDGLRSYCFQQVLQVGNIIGAGVDNGKRIATANDVAIRTVKGEGTGILRRDSPDARSDFDGKAVSRFKARVEIQCHWRQEPPTGRHRGDCRTQRKRI